MVCPFCGATIDDNSTSCPYCGKALNAQPAEPQADVDPIQGATSNPNPTPNPGPAYAPNPGMGYAPNPNMGPQPMVQSKNDHTSEFDPADCSSNKVLGLVCYLGLYFLIPLLTVKTPFVKFHANQGLVLMIASFARMLLNGIINLILNIIYGATNGAGVVGIIILLVSIIDVILAIFLLVLQIIGMVTAAKGKAKELPLIGKIHIIKYNK